jgi:predicted  nucleic acid-binding Zn-ribbon protein
MSGPGGDREYPHQRIPNVQDLDVTVLAFAQWLSEMKVRSNSSLQQMLAEMGIIRNGITSNNTELTEYKRNTATVQQQMQSQISDLRDKLSDAYQEIANMKKTKTQFEQEVHAECKSLSEQLQFKTLELETLKKAYTHTHQQLQQQIIELQTEVKDLRMRGEDSSRQHHMNFEHSVHKVSEVELSTQSATTEIRKLRAEHDSALAVTAENMGRLHETLRDLAREFHELQKANNVNNQRIHNSMIELQAKVGSVGPDTTAVNGQGSSQLPQRTQAPIIRPNSPGVSMNVPATRHSYAQPSAAPMSPYSALVSSPPGGQYVRQP